eukprot:12148759-Ditylum_brightwellii.AAC.1
MEDYVGSISRLKSLEKGLDNLENYFQAGITAFSLTQLPLPDDDDEVMGGKSAHLKRNVDAK